MPVKYTKEILEPIVAESTTMAEVGRKLGIKPHGGAQAHIKKRIEHYGISMDHFVGQAWSAGKVFDNRRKTSKEILKRLPEGSNRTKTSQLKRALIEEGIDEVCYQCGLSGQWNGKDLTYEIDHLDGDPMNNLIENLRFICPNCHTQTPTYKNRNRNK
jgi:hypothetical protein